MDAPGTFLSHIGELVIGAALAAVGWVMTTFTKRHIESMDRLTEKIGLISTDVTTMKNDIRTMATQQDKMDMRITKLEDYHLIEEAERRRS